MICLTYTDHRSSSEHSLLVVNLFSFRYVCNVLDGYEMCNVQGVYGTRHKLQKPFGPHHDICILLFKCKYICVWSDLHWDPCILWRVPYTQCAYYVVLCYSLYLFSALSCLHSEFTEIVKCTLSSISPRDNSVMSNVLRQMLCI